MTGGVRRPPKRDRIERATEELRAEAAEESAEPCSLFRLAEKGKKAATNFICSNAAGTAVFSRESSEKGRINLSIIN